MATALVSPFGGLALGDVYASELRLGDLVAVPDALAGVVVNLDPLEVRSSPHTPAVPAGAILGRFLDQLEAWVRLLDVWRRSPSASRCAACRTGSHDPANLR